MGRWDRWGRALAVVVGLSYAAVVSVQCGIVGLPNVGKSTLFNALTAAGAAVENRPFCTVDPNRAVTHVPEPRLDRLAELYSPEKVRRVQLDFVDIAGLVEGASRGEGLGNAFLAQIREVDAIVHVVRCFEDPSVAHQHGAIDPVRDVEVVRVELLLKDLETVERRLEKAQRGAKVGMKDARAQVPSLERFRDALAAGRAPEPDEGDDGSAALLDELFLLSLKPVVYVANVAEGDFGRESAALGALRQLAAGQSAPVIEVPARTEAELAELPGEDAVAFRAELGVAEGSVAALIGAVYERLGLITFFTVVGTEVAAWSIRAGTTAVAAAGKIHSDMERGFIRAEVVPFAVLAELGSEQAARDRGLLATQGRDYVVADGDVIRFKFKA
jgi:hypothetical protein